METERNLAFKYCQSIDKNLFEGLDNEFTLKYEYFFSSISKESIKDETKFIENFKSQVYSICSYKLTDKDKNDFNNYFKKFYFGKSS